MARSILSRLIDLFRSRSHTALDRLENPGAMARLQARDFAAEIGKLEEAIASVLTDRNVMEKQRDEAEASARLWRDKARAAVKAGHDTLAREALAREATAEAQQVALEQSLSRLHQSTNTLQEQLAILRQRKLEAHTQAAILDARAKAAQATEKSVRLLHAVGRHPDFSLNEIETAVEYREAHAEALGELVEASSPEGAAAFAQLAAPSLETRLTALKAEVADERSLVAR